jgi:hypothetical protein
MEVTREQAIREHVAELKPLVKKMQHQTIPDLFEAYCDDILDWDRLTPPEMRAVCDNLGWLEGMASAEDKTVAELLDEEGF